MTTPSHFPPVEELREAPEGSAEAETATEPRYVAALLACLTGLVSLVAGVSAYDVRAGLITLGVLLLGFGVLLGLDS